MLRHEVWLAANPKFRAEHTARTHAYQLEVAAERRRRAP
jgi:hypothetical protein